MMELTWGALAWCLLPISFVVVIYYRWRGDLTVVITAALRMVVQLVGVGFVLVSIFSYPSPLISAGILVVMMSVAAWIAIRPVRHLSGLLAPAMIALSFSVAIHLIITMVLVLDVTLWYEPRILIPLAGMYFANTMNTLSLAAERFYAEIHQGATGGKAKICAFDAAMIPQVNSLLAVGLVALPGMMTGQILSGVSPLIAVRYQIMIMAMILGTSAVGAAILLWLLTKQAVKDRN